MRPVGSPTRPVKPPTMSTAVWPRSWNWRSLRSTTAWPSVRLAPDGSMPSFTRSGRPSRSAASRRSARPPAGSTSAAPKASRSCACAQRRRQVVDGAAGRRGGGRGHGTSLPYARRAGRAAPRRARGSGGDGPAAGAGPVRADGRVAVDPEPPRHLGGDRDADPGAAADRRVRRPARRRGAGPARRGRAGRRRCRSPVRPSAEASRAGPRASSASVRAAGRRDRATSARRRPPGRPAAAPRWRRRRVRRRRCSTSACRRRSRRRGTRPGPNITAVRGVRPRNACEAGSAGPA